MALADYRLCDCCEAKTFYDANLDYVVPINTHPEWPNMVPAGLGSWAVICIDCSQKYRVAIINKETGNEV
jgi:hypothetical protein